MLAPCDVGIECLLRCRAEPGVSVAAFEREVCDVVMDSFVAIAKDRFVGGDVVEACPDRRDPGMWLEMTSSGIAA
jgi:hypothetical protein